jgi:hypothetical protein
MKRITVVPVLTGYKIPKEMFKRNQKSKRRKRNGR